MKVFSMIRCKIRDVFYSTLYIRDKIQKVDFHRAMSLEELKLNPDISVQFSTGNEFALKRILKSLKIEKNEGFFDFGCGKGAIIRTAMGFNFCRVGGCDLSRELIQIARNNLIKLKMMDERVKLIEADARDVVEIGKYNIFYFNNPFPNPVFSDVLENIKKYHADDTRRVIIIYENPLNDDTVINTGFKKIAEYTKERLFIAYKDIYVYKR